MEKKISQLTAKGANLSATDLLEISEETPDGFVSKSVTGSDIQQSVGKYGTQFGINTETPTHSLQVESGEQCIILAKTTNETGGGVALMDGNTSDELQVGVGAFANRLCLRSNTELFKFPTVDGTSGQAIVTDGSGNLSFDSVGGGVTLVAKKTQITNVGLATNVMIASEDISAHVTAASMLQITAFFKKTAGGSSSTFLRMYVNNSATLTGATLIGTFLRVTTAGTQTDNILNLYNDGTNFVVPATGTELTTRYNAYTGSVIAIPSPCYLIWGAQVPNGDTAILYNSNVIKYA